MHIYTKKYQWNIIFESRGEAGGREPGDAGSRLDQHIWLLRPGHPRHPLPVEVTADLVTMSIVNNILPGLPWTLPVEFEPQWTVSSPELSSSSVLPFSCPTVPLFLRSNKIYRTFKICKIIKLRHKNFEINNNLFQCIWALKSFSRGLWMIFTL